ncbi:transforming growth factor beta activator LRRC32 [Spea bombifrons]|uniref:transforming growth factor beta activator LRRC32 n=1 Tax=Spea bombifrons TaxID=233779 RepID=UPI00234AA509|nr:transforming growth factor beta activator LRRC32 [Spea bombifrons]
MLLYSILLLAIVKEGTPTYRPLEEPPCVTVNMAALCQNQSFHQIPLGLHPNIKSLDLSKNDLQNITKNPLFLYSFVEVLDLSANQIRFIQRDSFKHMVNLKDLNFSGNCLDRFAQHGSSGIGVLPHVQSLDLSRNSLYTDMTGYFVTEAPELRRLLLSENSITMLSSETFVGSPMLKELDLHNNIIMHIEEGTFEHLIHLAEINLAMNSISCISDFKLTQLESLNLSKNSIQTFHTSASDQEYNLRHVDLSDNKLLRFPVFPKANRLVSLNLSMNLISVGGETPSDDAGWMEDNFEFLSEAEGDLRNASAVILQSLAYLDLSYNNIRSVPEDFLLTVPFLTFLNLSRNCLEEVSFGVSVPLNSLVVLDLSGNNLRNVSVAPGSLLSLRELYLQDNQLRITHPDVFQGLGSVFSINLQGNSIALCSEGFGMLEKRGEERGCASFSNIPSLRHLNLRENNIQNVPHYAFYGTPLASLDLSMNRGVTIAPSALAGLERSLEVLYVEGCGLKQLNVDLPLFVYLKDLDLSGNRLSWLPAWNKHCRLETLDLSNNSFSDLEASNIPVLENTLRTICFYGNPLTCCSNTWITHLYRRTTVTIAALDSTTCRNPEGYEGETPVGQISPEICEKDNSNKMNTVVIVLIVMAVLLVIAAALGTLCHFYRQKLRRRYKA